MDEEAAAAIAPHLAPEEKLLWSGRPRPSLYAWNNGVGLIIVALMLAFGTVIYSFRSVLAVLAAAVGVAFFLHRKAQSVRYGLTDRHAIIAAHWPWRTVRAIPVSQLNICHVDGENDDKDPTTVLFRKGWFDGWWGRPFEIDAFIGVVPSRAVVELIRGVVGHHTVRPRRGKPRGS